MTHFKMNLKIIKKEIFGSIEEKMKLKALIISERTKLSKKEINLLSKRKPWELSYLKETLNHLIKSSL